MKRSIHHLAISTPNLSRAIDFYCDVIGFDFEGKWSWPIGSTEADQVIGLKDSSAEYVMLKMGDVRLEIFEFQTPTPLPLSNHRACDHGIPHFCIEVEDIETEYSRLVEAGMSFHTSIKVIEGDACTYGRDPDGNIIEIIQSNYE